MSDDEVHYVYMKGHGWVPKLGPVKSKDEEVWDRYWLVYMQDELLEAARREIRITGWHSQYNQRPVRYEPPLQQIPRTPDTYTRRSGNSAGTSNTYYYSNNGPILHNMILGDATEEELAQNSGSRYFPGTSSRPEPARPENQHERRAREYREALRRTRGR